MRIAFMGTPDFAVAALDALIGAGHDVAAVYTQPPRPANRGRLTASPVQMRAEALGLTVRCPANFRGEADRAAFAALNLDIAIVAAYGLILPGAVLDAPRHGCLNIHASLLPRWRGAAPVQRAIMAGDIQTGVTIMRMERGLDTGPMLAATAVATGTKTAGALTLELAEIGARLLVETLPLLPGIAEIPQPAEGITYAQKIAKSEARIVWSATADDVVRLVRAMHPAPGAWFAAEGQRVKLLNAEAVAASGRPGAIMPDGSVGCGSGAVRLITVQPEGKAAMLAGDWLRGRRMTSGSSLS